MAYPVNIITDGQKAEYLMGVLKLADADAHLLKKYCNIECAEVCKSILAKVGEKPAITAEAKFKQLFNKNLKLNSVISKVYSKQVKVPKVEGCVTHSFPESITQYTNSDMSNCIEVVPHNSDLLGVTYQAYPLSLFTRFYYNAQKNKLVLYISLPLTLNAQYSEKLIVFSESIFLWRKLFQPIDVVFVIVSTETLEKRPFKDTVRSLESRGCNIFYYRFTRSWNDNARLLKGFLASLDF